MAKKKVKIVLPTAVVHIHTTFNNTIMSVADEAGDVKL